MKKRGGEDKNVLVSSLSSIPGYSVVESKGFVFGSAVDFIPADRVLYATIFSVFDRDARHRLYETFFRRLRHKAVSRLMDNARALGANAVVGVRIQIWRAGYGMYEAYAYGTAVEVKKE